MNKVWRCLPKNFQIASSLLTFGIKSVCLQLLFFTLILIVSVSGPAFRGILLQARTAQDRTPMGTWNLPAGGNFKLLDCSLRTSSALTHANREDKTNQVFSWNPPDGSSATNFTV